MNKNTYKDLKVWQKAKALAIAVYKLTKTFPREEAYGLSSQMQRAAISIPSNIAEGKLRGGTNEWRRFLLIAYGSAGELETQVDIAKDLGYGEEEQYVLVENLLVEVMKMLTVMTGPSAHASRLTPHA